MSCSNLKRTCDECVLSKVKCDGKLPCSRCTERKLDCFYRPRKKRVVLRRKENSTKKSQKKDPPPFEDREARVALIKDVVFHEANSELLLHERISLAVFFTIYKNYAMDCSTIWFETQMKRIVRRLEQAHPSPESKLGHVKELVEHWASTLAQVDHTKLENRFGECKPFSHQEGSFTRDLIYKGWLHLHFHNLGEDNLCNIQCSHDNTTCSHGETCPGLSSHTLATTPVHSFQEQYPEVNPAFPRLTCRTEGVYPNDHMTCHVNEAFQQIFGITQTTINEHCERMGAGLLPWGLDIITPFIVLEEDVFALVHIIGITLGACVFRIPAHHQKEDGILIREFPTAHMVQCRTTSVDKLVPCIMKSVHRETLDRNKGVTLEFCMTFEPMIQLATRNLPATLSDYSITASSSSSLGGGNGGSGSDSPSTMGELEAALIPISEDELLNSPTNFLNSIDLSEEEEEIGKPPQSMIFPEIDFQAPCDDFMKDLLYFSRLDQDHEETF